MGDRKRRSVREGEKRRMEPLSARGLPRLSWIDTLYSSTYLSVPSSLHHIYSPTPLLLLHLFALHPSRKTSFTSSRFTISPPFSISRVVDSRSNQSSATQHSLQQDFQLVCITVAVHNKTVDSLVPSPHFPSGDTTGREARRDLGAVERENVSRGYNPEPELCVPHASCLMLNF